MTDSAFDTAEWREQANREIVTRRCPICTARGLLLVVRGFTATGGALSGSSLKASVRLETRCACLGCGVIWRMTPQ